MKWVAVITFVLIVIAACVTFFFVGTLKPSSTTAYLFFAGWLTLPHVFIYAALIVLQRKRKGSLYWYLAGVMVSVGGVVFLADIFYWHPDAQGAIAVIMTPILQLVMLIVLVPVAWWLSRNTRG